MTIKLIVTIKGDINKQLNQFSNEFQEKVLRSASHAGAMVAYNKLHQNVPVKSGKMKSDIYRKHIPEVSHKNFQMYKVGIKHHPKTGSPHVWWLEYGHIFYYATAKTKEGEYYTVVRPEKRGTPKPKEGATRAELDAYYLPRKDGPYTLLGTGFVRRSYDEAEPLILNAVVKRIQERMKELQSNPSGAMPDVD